MRPGKKHTGLEGRSEVATENARPENKQKKHFGFEGRAPKMRDQKKNSLAFTGGRKKMRDQKKTCPYSRTAASHTPPENAWRQSGAVPGMGQEKHPGFFELGQRKYATRKKLVADTNA